MVTMPAAMSLRVARRYAAGSAATLLLVWWLRPWGILLLWPALALAAMAVAYAGAGVRVFRKTAGRLPVSTRVLLAPYLLGAHVYFLFYSRAKPAFAEIVPGLKIGRRFSEGEARKAAASGVTAVLDLTAEYSETARFRQLAYRNVPILDLTTPSLQQLSEAVQFIQEHIGGGCVYVHCALGYSRSACVAAAYLLASGAAAEPMEAIERVMSAGRRVVITEGLRRALQAFAESQAGGTSSLPAADSGRFSAPQPLL